MNKELSKLRRSISFHYQPTVKEWWANDSSTHIHADAKTPYEALKLLIVKLRKAGEIPQENQDV